MDKIVLSNPSAFDLESAVITHFSDNNTYVIDVYGPHGHMELSAATIGAVKGKFTKTFPPLTLDTRAEWDTYVGNTITEKSKEPTLIHDSEVDPEATQIQSKTEGELSFIAKHLVMWIDALPEEVKLNRYDINGTLYSFVELKIALEQQSEVGKLLIKSVLEMTLKFIEGALSEDTVREALPPEKGEVEDIEEAEAVEEPVRIEATFSELMTLGILGKVERLSIGESEMRFTVTAEKSEFDKLPESFVELTTPVRVFYV